MKTLAEQREAFEAQRKAKATERDGLMTKAGEEGRTLDETEGQAYETLDGEVKSLDLHIGRIKRAEASMLEGTGTTVINKEGTGNGSDPTKAPLQLKAPAEKLEKGQAFARYVMCHVAAKGNAQMAFHLAQRH